VKCWAESGDQSLRLAFLESWRDADLPPIFLSGLVFIPGFFIDDQETLEAQG